MTALPKLTEEPGWIGAFTREQAAGALPNGTPIVKVQTENGDAHPVGTLGVVLGSFSHPEILDGQLFYFTEWTHKPRVAVAVVAWKIERAA